MKNILSNNLLMLKYINKYSKMLVFSTFLSSMLNSIMGIMNLLFTRYIINSLTLGIDFRRIALASILLGISNLVGRLFNAYLQESIIPKHTEKLNTEMQSLVYEKSFALDYENYESPEFFDDYALALEQSGGRAINVLNSFSTFISNILGIGTLSTLLLTFDPIVPVTIILSVAISLIFNSKQAKLRYNFIQSNIEKQRKSQYTQMLFYQQSYVKEIRLYPKIKELILQKFNKNSNDKIYELQKFSNKRIKFTTGQLFINFLSNTTILLYLSYKVIFKLIPLGDYVVLQGGAQQLAGEITQLFSFFPELYEHNKYIEHFKNFVNLETKINEVPHGKAVQNHPEIQLENVKFHYSSSDTYILDDISLSIAPGEKIAFVGRNGVGKSTIIKLLVRLYNPTSGYLLLDNIPYSSYSLNSIRSSIACMSQEHILFSYSILENILMRPVEDYKKDRDVVLKALRAVGLYEKIMLLKDDIHTYIGREFNNEGIFLSGGELQKIIVARIFVKDSKIIILDEPSSALDPISEEKLFETIINFSKDKTIILISHRLSNIKLVDKIYYLQKGKIVEKGTHQELLSQKGLYSSMYVTQSKNYLEDFENANFKS